MSEIRICENCKYHNNINNLECEKCGFDLSFVIPINESEANTGTDDNTTALEEKTAQSDLNLVSVDGQLSIPITHELVIGRDGVNGDYFDQSNYVSRKHAIFYIENGEVLVFDASTNGTYINDKRIAKLTKTPIHKFDKITFADVPFEVKDAN